MGTQTYDMNNRLFYFYINHLFKDYKRCWLNKYGGKSIDPEAKIDIKDEFTLRSLCKTDYSLKIGKDINIIRFISDLKKWVAFINQAEPALVVKNCDPNKMAIKLDIVNSKDFLTLTQYLEVLQGQQMEEC